MQPDVKNLQNFFSRIVYSSSNEDGRSELEALNLSETDHVLAVTGSGSRILELLLSNPKSVTAIDFNLNQNYLLALKICALKYLNNQTFLKFLGLIKSDSQTRFQLYQAISQYLSEEEKIYWNYNIRLIKAGLLFCGTWEKYLLILSKFLFFKRNTLHKLWNAKDLSTQIKIWESEWKGKFWKFSLKFISHRFVWKYIINEPGIYCVSNELNIFKYMEDCFDQFVHRQLLRESFFAQMIFYGQLSNKGALPLYLRNENLDIIRSRLDRIRIIQADLQTFLHDPQNAHSFDAFSLSDFSSYASAESYQAIWDGLCCVARPHARICERQFLVKYRPKNHHKIKFDYDLEKRLQIADSSFIYSFVCGKIF